MTNELGRVGWVAVITKCEKLLRYLPGASEKKNHSHLQLEYPVSENVTVSITVLGEHIELPLEET